MLWSHLWRPRGSKTSPNRLQARRARSVHVVLHAHLTHEHGPSPDHHGPASGRPSGWTPRAPLGRPDARRRRARCRGRSQRRRQVHSPGGARRPAIAHNRPGGGPLRRRPPPGRVRPQDDLVHRDLPLEQSLDASAALTVSEDAGAHVGRPSAASSATSTSSSSGPSRSGRYRAASASAPASPPSSSPSPAPSSSTNRRLAWTRSPPRRSWSPCGTSPAAGPRSC